MPGFLIWSAISLMLVGIGIWTWKSDKAAGFFAGVKPPEVKDVRAYNHAAAWLWFGYAAVFELIGTALLFLKQNPALLILVILGTAFATIALAAGYHRILQKHRKA